MAGKKITLKINVNIEIMYLGDWRIGADDRLKYDSYFQQCTPTQGYVTGVNLIKTIILRKKLDLFF